MSFSKVFSPESTGFERREGSIIDGVCGRIGKILKDLNDSLHLVPSTIKNWCLEFVLGLFTQYIACIDQETGTHSSTYSLTIKPSDRRNHRTTRRNHHRRSHRTILQRPKSNHNNEVTRRPRQLADGLAKPVFHLKKPQKPPSKEQTQENLKKIH